MNIINQNLHTNNLYISRLAFTQ